MRTTPEVRRPRARTTWRWVAALASLLLIAGCGGDAGSGAGADPGTGGPPSIGPTGSTFVLMPASTQLPIDAHATFFALQAPGAIAWSSSDSEIASVDANGQVTAMARGAAVITATSQGISASAAVQVYRASGTGADVKSTALIAQALAAGTISAEQALIYRVYAQVGDVRLPAAYSGAPSATPDHLLLREVASKMTSLSQGAQDLLRPFFVPPLYAASWYAQQLGALEPAASARSTAQSAALHPAAVLANCDFAAKPLFIGKVTTDHFNVFYIGPPFFDKNKELAELVGSVAEEAYTAETALLGRFPQSDKDIACNGGDEKVDIYLTLGKDPNIVGQTVPYSATCDNTPSFILLNEFSTPVFLAYNSPAARAHDIMKSVVGHELMHVIQFAMSRATTCDDMKWFDEATAEWAMDFVVEKFAPDQLAFPGIEDGINTVAAKRRSGAFLAQYLYSGHMRSLEKGVADDSFGYADYLFFQFLARKYKPFTIRQIYDQMAGGASSIDAISLAIDPKTAWPEFAKSLWNDVENHVLDYWEKEDGYDFGLYDVFHNTSRLTGAPTNLKPLEIDQLDKPDAVFTLLDNALLASKSGDYEIAPRSMFYEELKFTDSKVHSVVFTNPVADAPDKEFIKVQVLKKIGGVWKDPEDWTNEAFKAFCLDQKNERIEELLVIVSNAEMAPKTEQPFRIGLAAPMQVSTSNVGCWRFQGTATTTTQAVGGLVTVASASVVFDRFQDKPPLNLPDGGISLGFDLFTAAAGGSVSFSISGFDAPSGCTFTGNATATMPGDNDGSLIANFGLPEPLYRIVIGEGGRSIPVSVTAACGGSVETFVVDETARWLSFPDPGATISSDGQTIGGTWTRVDSDGTKTTVWDFRSVREP